jgi:hypothetical protein
MKKSLLPGIVFLLILISCRKLDNDVFFKIGEGLEYNFSDIDLYDTSTNILYFKNVHIEFKDIEKNSFTFQDDGGVIYSGTFWSSYYNSLPTGPFIYSQPALFGNYALKIDYWNSGKPDVRKDPRMIAVLKQHDLLHSGLALSFGPPEITGSQLIFKFTVTNQDKSNLLIIDPDKTGPNLFHFFTNGLYIRDSAYNEVFTSNIQHQTPDPWDTWKIEWLSQLKSGDSKQFTINYTINNPLNPGVYDATFVFPGLEFQVTKDQLYQGSDRIWLGGIQGTRKITVQ